MSPSHSPLEQTWSLCDLALRPLKCNVLPSLHGIANVYYSSLRQLMTELCQGEAADSRIKMLDSLKTQHDELLNDVVKHIDFLQDIILGCKKRSHESSSRLQTQEPESYYADSSMDVVFLSDKDAASS